MVYAKCHPTRQHEAKGLCKICYCETIKKKSKIKAKCHPQREHKARGLCDTCYATVRYRKNPNYAKVLIAMNTWQEKLEDPSILRQVLEGIFTHRPATTNEII